MKKTINKLLLIIFPAILLFSCKKDDFSEKDALDAQQTIDLAITVIDASSASEPVSGATVKLLKDSTLVSKTTNNNGTVVFTKVKIGDVAVVSVTKDQFTSVLTTVNASPDSYRQTQVSEMIKIYSLSSGKTATIRGRLTMQSDLTDRDREPATNVIVKVKNLTISSEMLFTATTDNDGKYSVTVPVSSKGDYLELYYPEFTTNQKLAFVQDDRSVAVAERPVLYKSDESSQFYIPAIPSVYATVASPTFSAGTGFALGSKPNRVPLSTYSEFILIDGGSGYNGGVSRSDYLLSFSPDPNGVSAKLQVDIVNGKITHIDNFINNGATYSSAPTLVVNDLSPVTPATILINFETTYKIYIANRGTGYNYFPQVSAEFEYFYNGQRVKAVDPDINDNSNSYLGYSNLLTNYGNIYGGMIKSSNGDTLILDSNEFSSAPVFSVVQGSTKRAVLDVPIGSINIDSTLVYINVVDRGAGYDQSNPPVVTLNILAGYGSGAVAKATVNDSGSLSFVYITNPGRKFVRNVNDYKNNGTTSSTYDNPDYPDQYYDGVKPGDIIVQDVYYGTGYQVLNQNTGKK
jgi:hypothetical protein